MNQANTVNENEEFKSEESDTTETPEKQKIKIEFPYSDLIREKVPKVFDVAETVATQWKNNEKFENLGLQHPLAEVAAGKVLEKAKEVEKKLEEKGVFSLAKMGVALAKAQANEILSKIKK